MGAENAHHASKTARKLICAELLRHSRKDGEAFQSIIITRGETLVRPYDPPMERCGMASPFVATHEKIQGADFCGKSHGWRLLGH
jgi:hypothetical protein